ncbi:MAG: hypothetical protein M5U35_02860 [Roseovarius sp.]|nr:hypothetical protein [Roseovarius sp.]
MLALASPSGFVLFAVVSICLSLALLPVTLSRAGGPGIVLATRVGLGRLLAISPVALAGTFTMGAVVGAYFFDVALGQPCAGVRRRGNRLDSLGHADRRAGVPVAARLAVRPV